MIVEEMARKKSSRTKISRAKPILFAFFDVLGFSKMVAENSADKIADLYDTLIEKTVKKEASRCLGLASDGTGVSYPALFSLDVKHAYFSDTIFMWVPLEKIFAAPFVAHCATFVCECLEMEIPVRGVIALGEAVMDEKTGTYIGTPIVEGAECEKIQEWLGVAFAPSATWPQFVAEIQPSLIIEYDIPVKAGKADSLPPIALNWCRHWDELHGSPSTKKLAELQAKSPHPKIENAIKFAEHCAQNVDWHLRPSEYFDGKRLKLASMSSVV
jgi:hypothetical protein